MTIKFTVLGEPRGKGRPRFQKVGKFVKPYTPQDTVVYENLIVTEYRRQCRDARFGEKETLDMRIIAYYGIPASTSNSKRGAMLLGSVRPIKKPDADNIVKVVCDALNGVAFRDDVQVVDMQVRRFYSDTPRLEITIQSASK